MPANLVIVESPAKAKTIEKFLGAGFLVKSSFGHIRDLVEKSLGIDVNNNFQPEYVVSDDKQKVVAELKKLAAKADTVWLASDEDREGEAIAWHLFETLQLDPARTRRIVFHEITKEAILHAVQHPRTIDMHLVDAQQARRVLDRMVGFEVSPVLWKKVKSGLSAGRVQSVAVKLIVEREREALYFQPVPTFRVSGLFAPAGGEAKFRLKADLSERFADSAAAEQFLNTCKAASYTIKGVEKKPLKRMPAAPFTTSTLQQEASRKHGFAVGQTMSIAQRLYEAGLITYMRTDSTNLSEMALQAAHRTIEKLYGAGYAKTRRFATKSKNAQEAHEAIRPTYLENVEIDGSPQERKLYDLIWKRTVASQMAEAQLEKTEVTIGLSNAPQTFQATGEVILFDGFLKVYMETNDDEPEDSTDSGLLPPLTGGQQLAALEVTATERFSQRPARYTEASLVKRLEELGIGRPSTYAPTISTIINRGYVTKEDRPGVERRYVQLLLAGQVITRRTLSEVAGTEKSKLFPSDIGMLVNDFLNAHFKDIVDYGFTANVEEEFDEIAAGKLVWNKMIGKFYAPFHRNVAHTLETSQIMNAARVLGTDPRSGKSVSVRIGRYGPLAQIGDEGDEKKQFASLQKGQLIETITLAEALKLFELPRPVGTYEDREVVASVGRFGPYIRFGSEFVSLRREDSPYTVTLERAVELIEEKRKKEREKHIKTFEAEDIQVLNGRYGPYIAHAGSNFKIPKAAVPQALTLEECQEIIASQKDRVKTKPAGRKTAAVKKTATKKAAATKPAAAKKKAPAKKTAAKKKA